MIGLMENKPKALRASEREGASAKEKRSAKLRSLSRPIFTFDNLCVVFLVCVFALPQYFGIGTSAFALTAQRMVLLLVLLAIAIDKGKKSSFVRMSSMCLFVAACAPLLIVAFYTAAIRSTPNTLMQILFDNVLPFLIVLYMAWYRVGVERIVGILVKIFAVVCLIAIFDGLRRTNLYDYIHTISSVLGGSDWRASQYRVAAMCSHPIGFGLYIILMTPLLCIDFKRRAIDISQHWPVLLLAIVSMLFTGSRFPQAMFAVEIILLFVLTDRRARSQMTGYVAIGVLVAIFAIVAFPENRIIKQYVLLNAAQICDAVLGTDFTSSFGYWQSTLAASSSDYRSLLPLIFFSDKLDPLIGGYTGPIVIEGIDLSKTIDNNYVSTYVDLAWPGVVSTLFLFAFMLWTSLQGWRNTRSPLCVCLGIGFILYFVSLWFVDYLGTYKYLFALFALVYAEARQASERKRDGRRR